jgi:hypothetical protein
VEVVETQYMPVVEGVLQTLLPQVQGLGFGEAPSVMVQAATQEGSGEDWHLFSGR